MTGTPDPGLALIADLKAEYAALDEVLGTLDERQWRWLTPFRDWTVFDTVAHLCISERTGLAAVTDPEAFARQVQAYMQSQKNAPTDPPDWRRVALPELGADTGAAIHGLWRAAAHGLADVLAGLPRDMRIPWYGPSMSRLSFATARLMETWAHGETLHDALGLPRRGTHRLRHVCELGWRTRGFALMIHGLPADDTPIGLRLTAPGDEIWTWGDGGAANKITGNARDFARVVCQCRHVLDTSLCVEGEAAVRWMSVAQCFVGGPADPPRPGARKTPADEGGVT